ncbi:MAG: transcription-repair coupling factor [Candidatus Muiribacteriota bacterium]
MNKRFRTFFNKLIDEKKINNLYGDSYLYYINSFQDPVLCVFRNISEAEENYLKIKKMFPQKKIFYFPEWDRLFFENTIPEHSIEAERCNVLNEIIKRRNESIIIFTTVKSFYSRILDQNLLKDNTLRIKKNSPFKREEIVKKIIQAGYERVDEITKPGEFALRGEVFDIFIPGKKQGHRIVSAFEEVEKIKSIDSATGNSLKNEEQDSIEIIPVREVINNVEYFKTPFQDIQITLEKLYDNYPFFYKKSSSLSSYLKNGVVIFFEKEMINKKLKYIKEEIASFDENYEKFLIDDEKINLKKIYTSLLRDFKNPRSPQISSIPFFEKKMSSVAQFILTKLAASKSIVVTFENKAKLIRFKEIMKDFSLEISDVNEEIPDKSGCFGALIPISSGFEIRELNLLIIGEENIWGKKKKITSLVKKNRPRIKKSMFDIFSELNEGDFAVHINHGIGIYKGIKKIRFGKIYKEFFNLEYKNDDELFVPIENADFIHKYVGKDKPQIYTLGGKKWKGLKKKTKKKVKSIAKELMKLYADRLNSKGIKFDNDNHWQHELEASFEFDETPDQIKVISEVKEDMQKIIPMDRLICGDVGYGKTEIALRAAFKAVMSSRQVAILAPTTILVQQHFNTFKERFKMFPVEVESVSRMKTASQIKEVFDKTAEGKVDVVIGTHKLLSKKVVWNNLGLLIVDEEQRFGVTHKEKIKKFKTNIDVLTMTATPIPRTLNMSLNGIRDISILETAPENRQSVKTFVLPFSKQLLKEAILREHGRGGQVYFLHNKVSTINIVKRQLKEMMPELNFEISHGQMERKKLNEIMRDFIEKKIDVLITTTIIESGIDIPNVNTIIIQNSHRFGLSQLYQLKGRVGRSERQAYAYLFYPESESLTENAYQRLKTLREHTELGSGFKISMKDLEIRGSGDVFGGKQHGFMDEVGFEMYCKILKEVISEERGDSHEEFLQIKFGLPVNAYIPDNFIDELRLKIEIYKKVASCDSTENISMLMDEMRDRFGRLPQEVINLIKIQKLKISGRKVLLKEISQYDSNNIQIKFYKLDFTEKGLNKFFKEFGKYINLQINLKNSIIIKINSSDSQVIFGLLEKILQFIKFCVNI